MSTAEPHPSPAVGDADSDEAHEPEIVTPILLNEAGNPVSVVGPKRLIAIGVVGALLVAGVTWMLWPREETQRTMTRIMIMGDSISHGSVREFTWRYRFWNLVGSGRTGLCLVGPNQDVIDHVTGQTSQDYRDPLFDQRAHAAQSGVMVAELQGRSGLYVREYKPDVLLLLAGSNDVVKGRTVDQMMADFDRLVSAARTANPDITVIIGQVLGRNDAVTKQPVAVPIMAELNSQLREWVAQVSTDTSPVRMADTAATWDAAVYTVDGVHPNPLGEDVIAHAFAEALEREGIVAKPGLPEPGNDSCGEPLAAT